MEWGEGSPQLIEGIILPVAFVLEIRLLGPYAQKS